MHTQLYKRTYPIHINTYIHIHSSTDTYIHTHTNITTYSHIHTFKLIQTYGNIHTSKRTLMLNYRYFSLTHTYTLITPLYT